MWFHDIFMMRFYVDGKETETFEAAGKLLSIETDPGNHEIELVYKAAGRTLGITISCISFLFLLYILWVENNAIYREKINEKKYKK